MLYPASFVEGIRGTSAPMVAYLAGYVHATLIPYDANEVYDTEGPTTTLAPESSFPAAFLRQANRNIATISVWPCQV